MIELLGCAQGSDMPSVHVHLSGRDVDSALLKAHGIRPEEREKTKPGLTFTSCPRRTQKAGPEAQFCPYCGLILDIKAAAKLEEDRGKAYEIMDILLRNEEARNLLAKKIHELWALLSLVPQLKQLFSLVR